MDGKRKSKIRHLHPRIRKSTKKMKKKRFRLRFFLLPPIWKMYGNIYYFHSYLQGEEDEGKVGVVLSCLAKLYFATTVNLEHISSELNLFL